MCRLPIEPAEAHATLARHVQVIIARALDGLSDAERKTRQPEIVNRIVELLAADAHLRAGGAESDAVAVPPEELQAV
jgi:hypothetical protein